MDFSLSEHARANLHRLREFMDAEVYPSESVILDANQRLNSGGNWRQWTEPEGFVELKRKAKDAGLWNLFLPDAELGQGLSCCEYAPLAEEMGRVVFAPDVFNCNAPDTGNMEVLYHYGSEQQKQRWLAPLLAGDIRSVFCMTEPDVASSDATNMQATIVEDGEHLILNGRKWWTTGLGHPNARVAIFMGRSNPDAPKHEQHAMVIVPLDSEGITIERMLPVYHDYHAPSGHGEVNFHDVRVPHDHVIWELGKGFAIAQGRLGPGRVHHCMRAIGMAERALSLAIERGMTRVAFGKPLLQLGGNAERIAQARLAIDQARLLTLNAAWKIDHEGVRHAMTEISAIKIVVPNMLQEVVDIAIQLYGGAGMSDDTPLASFAAAARALRLADGPDEVHLAKVARLEMAKYQETHS